MKFKLIFIVLVLATIFYGCRCESEEPGFETSERPELSGSKDKDIRSYNLDVEKEEVSRRTPCDTIALKQYILDNYPAGDYLVEFDKTYTYNIPKSAVLYYRGEDSRQYIFAVIAKSKPGERFIETKNVVGFESSFINLDSTKLGTAFFFLTLFECNRDNEFDVLWEAEVPIHGGFNAMRVKRWRTRNLLYIEMNYEDGIISGHRNYNFFFVDGIRSKPHLMETYAGLVHLRTMADVNKDKYPDYYEYRFIDSANYIAIFDSIPFYWDTKRELYVTKVNRRWFRYY
ncbi:MAG: hypothetical protein A2V66_14290 [Ignavibacteria bacterium RBG_13_36_8]|nr:MAG: hypothetical protein A2V66_14290 [Ignavibacteria bacterium RBG_13_36_8]